MLFAAALLALTLVLAYSNGANDVSKGVATLAGSGVSNYRTAIGWGAFCTVAGAIAAAFASQTLVATFSGRTLMAGSELPPSFMLAVASGAIVWLVIATMTGLPVSTTHALAGALIGTAVVASGTAGILWPVVTRTIAVPLLVSPLLSLALVLLLVPLLQPLGRRFSRYCVCLEQKPASLMTAGGVAFQQTAPRVEIAESVTCSPSVARIGAIDALHWLSSGAASFSRGMHDAPKVLALGVVAASMVGVSATALYGAVALSMGAGSIVAGFRVTRTLAEKVTPIAPVDGLAANLVTSMLVAVATRFALPVSTTQVSSGAIVGAGVARGGRDVRWRTVGEMLLAWGVTLPASAAFAAIVFWLITRA